MRSFTLLFAILFATSSFAADRVAEERAAETGFAKAFADRDATKFASFIDRKRRGDEGVGAKC
jgi:hypothetical protein